MEDRNKATICSVALVMLQVMEEDKTLDPTEKRQLDLALYHIAHAAKVSWPEEKPVDAKLLCSHCRVEIPKGEGYIDKNTGKFYCGQLHCALANAEQDF